MVDALIILGVLSCGFMMALCVLIIIFSDTKKG